jgi:hypothetical protein
LVHQKTAVFDAQGSPEILTNFRAATGAGRHFSPQTQAFTPEKYAKPTRMSSVSIEQAVLFASVDDL